MTSAAATLQPGASHHVLLSALPDERLAKLAAQGSTPAFAVIYKRHHQDVYRYCQSVIGNEQDARDALQETMIKAMRALQGERRDIALRPWLFRIAHNESVTLMRKRRPSTSLESIAELPATGDDADLARERVHELFDDLAHLTHRQRGALVMRELNGMSFQEIATTMSISAAAAKQTVYEARQALLDVNRGREADCRDVRERISAGDRRLLRGRGVRAHLRSCAECREFETGIATRGERLAAVAPLPAAASAGILEQVLGVAGGSAAGGGGIAILAAGGGLSTVAKLGVAGVVALGVGAVAVETRDADPAGGAAGGGAAAAPVIERAARLDPGGAAAGGVATSKGAGAASERNAAGQAANGSDDHGTDRAGGGASEDAGQGAGGGGGAASTGPAAGPEGSEAESGSGHGGSGAGAIGSGGSSGGGSLPGSSGGSGTGSAGGSPPHGAVLPPGHGGTPPGHGGSPPGLDGELPPGLGGTPPGLDGEVPPGQGGTPPGQTGTAPGLLDRHN